MEWQLKEQAPRSFFQKFPEFNNLVLNLLWERGTRTQEAIDKFFNPDYNVDLHNPFLMLGMDRAVSRITEAILSKEKIAIFGDYDVDGISGSVILASLLKKTGVDFRVYIPDRGKEGYGMNIPAVEELTGWGANLIVVIDSGIANFEEVGKANEFGVDVIIVDHHQPQKELPKALVILNPHLSDDKYPFKELVATGITFKLTEALISTLRKKGFDFQEGAEKWFLDLVALATIADVAPLSGENRVLCKYGLAVLAKTQRVGLKELINMVGVKPYVVEPLLQVKLENNDNNRRVRKHPNTNLNSQIVSFMLINRLNAASRMDHAKISFDLLMTDSVLEAKNLVLQLEIKMKERVKLVKKIVKEFETDYDSGQKALIFAGASGWSIGVLGIVANNLLDKYHKSAFIFEKRKDESVGSIRAEKSINVVDVLGVCSRYLVGYGGHPQSAGFRFRTASEEELKKCLITAMPQEIKEKTYPLEIDYELKLKEVNRELLKVLQAFEPFGMTNITPRFLIRNLRIIERKLVGAGKQHNKLILADPGNLSQVINALAFNKLLPDNLQIGEHVDVVAEIMTDEFRGSLNLSLKIIDIKLSFY